MAKTTVSATTRTIYVRSSPPYQGSMTVWALRDFLAALDAAGVPDDAKVNDEHNHETRHLIALNVRHTVTVEPAPGDGGGQP